MENLLELYAASYPDNEPVVCMDEKPIQMLDNKYFAHENNAPGHIRKYDYEYIRKSNANIFNAVEPKKGKHIARVYRKKRAKEFSLFLEQVSNQYPRTKTIHLVMDNLRTHYEKSLIKTFGEKKGKKLWSRFTPHYTPKHASWLNQAEIEIGVCTKQCLGKRRFGTIQFLRSEVLKWERRSNREKRKINWTFTTAKAKKKFRY